MLVYPDYYPKFKCVAGACTHSCCIGWEIDVDPEALERYRGMPGEIGQRLNEKIDWQADTPHFILDDKERCPFLNQEGLCDLICAGGEENLCQICSDHPRFRNFYSDRVEMGLGLCCEAAGRLILSNQARVQLVAEGEPDEPDEEERAFFAWREGLFDIAQDRSATLMDRMERLCQAAGVEMQSSPHRWAETFMQLETLEASWPDRLQVLKQMPETACVALDAPAMELPMEQLLVYFLYRHLAGALDDGWYQERLAFAILSVQMIRWLAACEADPLDMPALVEIARQYSAEIEYSQENLDALLDLLGE